MSTDWKLKNENRIYKIKIFGFTQIVLNILFTYYTHFPNFTTERKIGGLTINDLILFNLHFFSK